MIDAALRPLKDRVLAGAAQALSFAHPLVITAVGCVAGVAAAWCASVQQYWVALALFLFGRVCDGLDGAVARLTHTQSSLGGYLDLMADFVVYAAIPIGLWWGLRDQHSPLPLIVMLAVFYVNAASWMLLSALIENKDSHVSVAMPRGLVEGFETVIFYVLFLLFPAWSVDLYWVFSALVVVSVLQRIVWAVRFLR